MVQPPFGQYIGLQRTLTDELIGRSTEVTVLRDETLRTLIVVPAEGSQPAR